MGGPTLLDSKVGYRKQLVVCGPSFVAVRDDDVAGELRRQVASPRRGPANFEGEKASDWGGCLEALRGLPGHHGDRRYVAPNLLSLQSCPSGLRTAVDVVRKCPLNVHLDICTMLCYFVQIIPT